MAAPESSPTPAQREPLSGERMMMWGVAIVLVAAGLIGGKTNDSAAGPAHAGGAASHARPAAGQLPRSRPTRLLIPKIGVDAPFTELSLSDSGQLQPPPADDVNLVGWYVKGVTPGETGTAIIAGHVDTKTSAAVFAGLDELSAGDRFTVRREDGKDADFVVDSSEKFEKDDFPDRRVYADAPRAEARLITCAGDYDRGAADYTENLVVFAHLV
ncbi:class F sortase [Streptomyces sp. NPDC002514]|uniref:class F sortase n=1 Tax=unclassified Streptomyces TaxID=2593676 RepID=UPI0036BCD7DC